MGSEKYCKDCKFWNVPDDEQPCVSCDENKIMFETRYDDIEVVTTDYTRNWSTEDKRKLRDEIVGNAPKSKTVKPAHLYEGIDRGLLMRVRDIMDDYLDINSDIVSASMRDQIEHDIKLLTREIGDEEERRLEKLQSDLIYVLNCVKHIQIASNGESIPGINADELSDLVLWAETEAFIPTK